MLMKAEFWISTDKQDFPPEENEIEVGPRNEEWAKLVFHDTSTNMLMPTFEDFIQIDYGETTADDDIIQNCLRTCTDGNDSEDEANRLQILDTEVE